MKYQTPLAAECPASPSSKTPWFWLAGGAVGSIFSSLFSQKKRGGLTGINFLCLGGGAWGRGGDAATLAMSMPSLSPEIAGAEAGSGVRFSSLPMCRQVYK